jgi:hypothetical protein
MATSEACKALGIGRSTLQKLKAAGVFTAGRCFYFRGMGRSGPCMWNITTCRQVLMRLSAEGPSALDAFSHVGEEVES